MSTPLTKQQIIDKFNSLFRDQLNPAAGSAQWYSGSAPGSPPGSNIGTHPDLGSKVENAKQATDIPGAVMASTVFNVLHGLAMEFTRVRKARAVYLVQTPSNKDFTITGTVLTALHPRFALYFPIPGAQREPGTMINSSELDTFLAQLRSKVNDIRSNSSYAHTLVSAGGSSPGASAPVLCHTNCHSNCHGSRGRR